MKIYTKRLRLLEYYLRSAKTTGAKLYWMGRLDELKKLRKELR